MKSKSRSHAFWVSVISVAIALHLWLFFHIDFEIHPMLSRLAIAVHVVGCVGPFWMLADWFVKRKKKLQWKPWMWLFFVPWGFLWYIFEKWERPESDLLKVPR
jgi:hypothetical protein